MESFSLQLRPILLNRNSQGSVRNRISVLLKLALFYPPGGSKVSPSDILQGRFCVLYVAILCYEKFFKTHGIVQECMASQVWEQIVLSTIQQHVWRSNHVRFAYMAIYCVCERAPRPCCDLRAVYGGLGWVSRLIAGV